MKALRQKFDQLNRKYAAMTQRERLLVALALLLAPLLIANALILDPQSGRIKMLERNIASVSASLDTLRVQAASLQQELSQDPNAGKKAELAALIAQRDQLDDQLKALGSTLVRPEEMNGLLERLLARNAGLRLVSLKTLAPQSVLGNKETPKEGEAKPVERSFDLYRHGVEIRLEGSYAQLQSYLVQLEKLPQRLLWGKLSYRVIDYPRSEMTLTVYTLSPDKTWLTL